MLSLLNLGFFALATFAQSTWYVPDDFPTIQAGINGASGGDTVIVRDGVYQESLNILASITIRSENGPAGAIIDGGGDVAVYCHQDWAGRTIVFEGFTIVNASNSFSFTYCSPTIRNCVSKYSIGAGAYCKSLGNPRFESCTFVGGSNGVYCYDANPTLLDCSIVHATGVGVFCDRSRPLIDGCHIFSNASHGVLGRYDSRIKLMNSVVSNNGGDGFELGSTVNDPVEVMNCRIAFNQGVGIRGSGSGAQFEVRDSTIFGNGSFGIVANWVCFVSNSIVWSNGASFEFPNGSGSVDVEYSCLENVNLGSSWINAGCFGDDPQFIDLQLNDFRLKQFSTGHSVESPCVDAGPPAASPYGSTRIDGVDDTGVIDIGFRYLRPFDLDFDDDGLLDLDEYQALGTSLFAFDSDGDGLGDGLELGATLNSITSDTNRGVFQADADPASQSDPMLLDTDLGGVPDGIEDQDRDGQVDPWETDPTLIGDDQFAFYVNNLIPGERVQFDVYSSRTGSLIVPLYSISGSGPTALGIGVTVDLSLPIRVLNPAYTDSAGRASIRGPVVPQTAPIGLQVWSQGIEIPFAPGEVERVSNLVSLPVGTR